MLSRTQAGPGRSQARAGRNFSQPRTNLYFPLCRYSRRLTLPSTATASVISRGKDHKYADAGALNSPTLSRHQIWPPPPSSNFQLPATTSPFPPTHFINKDHLRLRKLNIHPCFHFRPPPPHSAPAPVRPTPPRLYEACRICFTPKVIYFSPPPGVESEEEPRNLIPRNISPPLCSSASNHPKSSLLDN